MRGVSGGRRPPVQNAAGGWEEKRTSLTARPTNVAVPSTISGYAATFRRLDAQSDLIQPGSFCDTLLRRRHRIPLPWQHDITEPLGRIQDIQEDDRGLWFRAELLPTRRGVDALRLIHSGALRECSIGFLPRRVRFQIHRGHRVRLVRELELVEISLVTLAANPAARILTVDGVPLDNGPPQNPS